MGTLNDKTRTELAAIRDTVESIWVAIVLAFVLRAFMIEAFVIPTGSMAPRLMGEHWDLKCPQCHYRYAYRMPSADSSQHPVSRGEPIPPTGARCPLCGAPFASTGREKQFVNGGDRVLVLKYLYRFREPKPWDVVVFRNPQNNQENYIKRLIGLPGESIMILHGNIFVKADDKAPWRIRRKPPRAQRAMWQLVHSIDYPPAEQYIKSGGIIPLWQEQEATAGWELGEAQGRRLVFQGSQSPCVLEWLARKNDLRSKDDRGSTDPEIIAGRRREPFLPRYGYNESERETMEAIDHEGDICTDLKLSAVFFPGDSSARLGMTMTSYDHHFRGTIQADGTVRLEHRSDKEPGKGWAEWSKGKVAHLTPGRGHRVALTHVDFRVGLWIDDTCVLQSTDGQYSPDVGALLKQATARLARRTGSSVDWTPTPIPRVSLFAQGGPCELRHVEVFRDEFYTTAWTSISDFGKLPLEKYAREIRKDPKLRGRNRWQRASPSDQNGRFVGWGVADNPITLRKHQDGEDPDLDEFFVLGDNSPQSLDGRSWVQAAPSLRLWTKDKDGNRVSQYQLGTVPRYNLIGKAFFVYWPSGFRVPGLPGLSVIPNVGKMRMIR